MNGDRLAAALRRPAIVALIWFAALFRLVGAFTSLPPLAHRLDFANYYDCALAMRQGLDPYTIDLTAIGNRLGLETGPLIHAADTPLFLLCFEPLTLFPPATAFWIWTALNLVALAVAIGLLVRRPDLDSATAWLLGALILTYYPVGWNFFWGQTQVLILMLLTLAMRAMDDEREGAAGLFVAIAGMLRAFPFLLLVYFALRRKWKALEFAIGGIVAGGLITVAFLGFARCFSFIHGALWVSNMDRMNFPFVISVAPFVSRMFWALFGSTPGPVADSIRRAAIVAVDAIILGMTIRATLAASGRRDYYYRIYSLWIVTALLLSPIAWHHYLVLLVIPFVQIAVATVHNPSRRRALWMAVASYLLASVSVPITFRMLAHPTAFQHALPTLSAPLLETGFFTLLMGYIATYWFTVDFKTDDRALEPHDVAEQAPNRLKTGS